MDIIVKYLQENIVLVMFLIIGLGHLVGKIKLGSIGLGPTTGILVVGILTGVLVPLNVPPIIKGLAFTLYLFTLGVQVGPGLIHMLTTRAALKYLVLGLSTAVFMAVSVFFVAKVFSLNNVVVGGLSSGAMTTSAILAAAQNVLESGSIKPPEGMSVKEASDLLGGAYAITYLFGTFGLIVLIKIAPMLIGKDIAVEAAKMDSGADARMDLGNRSAAIRAWRVTAPDFIGKTIAELEATAAKKEAEQGMPTLVEKVLRDGKPLELSPDLQLRSGDIVAVWAMPGILAFGAKVLGEEVTDPAVLTVKLASAELVVTNRELKGMSLAELIRQHGRGVTVERMVRRGDNLPVRGDLPLVSGDVIFASGPQRQLDAFAGQVGYVVKDQLATNLVTLGIFLAIGGVLGTISVTVSGITMSILGGSAIGAMIGGAVLSWLRSRSPLWGSVAAPAGDAIGAVSIGLFITAVAIGAGGSLIQVLQTLGLKLVLAGAIVTTFCTFATFLFGHFVLRLNVAENAGATCGAMTGVAIDEVVKDAKSGVPAIGYALPGAVNNLTFTIVALVLMAIL
ncbi:MAG: hypothetical protein ACM3SW_08885 [Actinomycetota bacterium]